MGRLNGGHGGKVRMNFDQMLRRHIESSMKKGCVTVQQLVEDLRSINPLYARQKLHPFTKRVDQNFQVLKRNIDNDYRRSSVKERRKPDQKEKKLQYTEAHHSRKRKQREVSTSSVDCSSSSLASTSSSDHDSFQEELSTSMDSVGLQKLDLVKSLLRDDLHKKSKNLVEGIELNKVELEIADEKDFNNREIENGDNKFGNDSIKISTNSDNGCSGKEINGPLFKDLGGMSSVIEELKVDFIRHMFHPQLLRHLGVEPMTGILLHGPPGCGKTKLAHAIANQARVPFYNISGRSGASESNIRELFTKARRTAPSIVFIDDIDAIASKGENSQKEMELRIVNQLKTCIDETHMFLKPTDEDESSDCGSGYVLVIGATNKPDAITPELRIPGRLEHEIVLGVPNEIDRVEILSILISKLKVEGGFDLLKIARCTPGFVGADLAGLVRKAGNLAARQFDQLKQRQFEDWWEQSWLPEEIQKLCITMADFEEAVKLVQPSSRREGFSAVPDVKWDDVGGLDFLRKEFDRYIVKRIKYPEDFEGYVGYLETGFLLYGPPGCGKTLIAKAVANEAGANFIHIKGPELLNKYVGESELAVRTIFRRARTCSPCILFFDEVDAITTKRGKEGGWVVEKLLTQLLIELDGAEKRNGVYVIGATNRPEVMDNAMFRPGRFGKLLYVPLPSPEERGRILKALARNIRMGPDVDLMELGKGNACEHFSGADLSALLGEAFMAALEDKWASEGSSKGERCSIKHTHLRRALSKISPSVSDEQIQYYEKLSEGFKAGRCPTTVGTGAGRPAGRPVLDVYELTVPVRHGHGSR